MEFIMANSKMDLNKAKVNLSGKMGLLIKEIFIKTKDMGKDIINRNKEVLKVNGETIK